MKPSVPRDFFFCVQSLPRMNHGAGCRSLLSRCDSVGGVKASGVRPCFVGAERPVNTTPRAPRSRFVGVARRQSPPAAS